MSQKAVTSVSFSIKKKEPIRIVKKNSLEQTTKKSTGLAKNHPKRDSAVKSEQDINQSSPNEQKQSAKELEK